MRKFVLLAFLFNAVLLTGQQSQWVGGHTGDPESMDEPLNWTPNGRPSSGNLLIFQKNTVPYLSPVNNLPGMFTLATGNSSILIQDAYTISGSAFVVPSGGAEIQFLQTSGISTISTGFTLGGTLTVSSPNSINNIIQNLTSTGGLSVTGTVVLGGANSYSGTTTVNAGATLFAGAGGAFSTSSEVVLDSGATLSLGSTTSFPCSIYSLSGSSGSFISLGNGSLTILNSPTSDTQTYAGTISASNGGFTIVDAVTMTISGANTNFSSKANPATVKVGTAANTAVMTMGSPNAFGNVASGGYANFSVAGTLNVSGYNLVAGTISSYNTSSTIDLGTGSGGLTVNGNSTFAGVISGAATGGLTAGSGTLTLTGTNTYSGATTIGTGGTLSISSASNIGSSTSLYFNTGASTLVASAGMTLSTLTSMNLNAGSFGTISVPTMADTVTIPCNILGAGNLVIQGPGTVSVGGSGSVYSGTTLIAGGGTLAATNAGALSASSVVTINSGSTLDLSGAGGNVAIPSLAGSWIASDNQATVALGSNGLIIVNGSTDYSYFGQITGGSDSSVNVYSGTVNLLGVMNPYTGTTVVANNATLNTLDFGNAATIFFDGAGEGSSSIKVCAGTPQLVLGSDASSSATIQINSEPMCPSATQYIGSISPNTYTINLTGSVTASAYGSLAFLGPGTTNFHPSAAVATSPKLYIRGGIVNVNQNAIGGSMQTTLMQFDTYGGTLQAGEALSFPETVYMSSSPYTITLGGVNCTFDANSYDITMGAQLIGGGNLIMTDSSGSPGVFSLTNSSVNPNNYAGTTTIVNGTLNILNATIPGAGGTETPTQLVFGGPYNANLSYAPVNPILQLGGSVPTFAPAVVLMSNGTIDTNGHGTMTITGVIAGTSTYTLKYIDSVGTGSHTLILSGANLYTGPTTVGDGTNAATLQAGSTSAFGVGSAVTVSSMGNLSLNTFNNTIGSLSGSGAVDLGTSGTLTISNGGTFTGDISDTSGGSLTLTGGTLALSGTNSYHGATTISGGTLTVNSTGALSSNSVIALASGGTVNLNGHASSMAALSGTGGTISIGAEILTLANGGGNTFGGNITDGGAGGGLTLTMGTQILSGSNSYSGTTTVNGGVLQAGSSTAFPSTSAVSLASGAELNLAGYNNTIASLVGPGTGSSIVLGSGTLTIADGDGQTYEGDITNNPCGGLTLTSGTLTLTGSNTYCGPTTVTGVGTTLIAGNGVTSPFGTDSYITVSNGAALNFGTVASEGIVGIGQLNDYGTVIADLSSVSATGTGIAIAGYTQKANNILTLNLPATPESGFEAFSSTGEVAVNGTLNLTLGGGSGTTMNPVILFQGPANQISGSFSSVSAPYKVQTSPADGQIFIQASDSSICNGTWDLPGSGAWATQAYWSPDTCIPGQVNVLDTATFPDLTNNPTIFISLTNQEGTANYDVSLYDMNFTALATSYNILSFYDATITLNGNSSPKPRVTVDGGSHAIYAPVILGLDSRFSLSGTLTMGILSSITGSNTLYISEGTYGGGTFINDGIIQPSNITIQGCTITNQSLINPSGTLTIQALADNTTDLIVNNTHVITAGTMVVDGSASTVIINNQGMGNTIYDVLSGYGEMYTGSGPFSVTTATVNNTLGALLFAGTDQTLTITQSLFTNDSTSQLGSSSSNIDFVSGMVNTTGAIAANNYMQGSGGTLQLNVLTQALSGNLTASGTANLGGTLVVNALSGFPLTLPQTIPLVTDTNGFLSQFTNFTLENFPTAVIPELIFSPTQILLNVTPVSNSHGTSSVTPKVVVGAISQHNSYITRAISRLAGRATPHAGQYVTEEAVAQEELTAQNEDLGQANLEIPQKQAQLARKGREKEIKPFSIYLGPTSTFGHVKTVGTNVGQGYVSAGGLLGFDAVLPTSGEGIVLGGIGALADYRRTWGTGLADSGTTGSDRIHGSIYGTIMPGNVPELYFELVMGFLYSWDRAGRFTGFENSLKAKSHTNEAVFDVLGGVEFAFNNRIISGMGNFTFIPLFHVQYINDHIGGYKETGAGIYDLTVSPQRVQALSTSLGARFDYLFTHEQFSLLMEVDAEWVRQYLNNDQTVFFTPFNLTSTPTAATLFGIPTNGLLVALDLFATFSTDWTLEMNSTLQWNSQAYDAFFYLGLGKEF